MSRRSQAFSGVAALAIIVGGCSQDPHAALPLRHPYDPRQTAQKCLRKDKLPVTAVGVRELVVGSGAGAPSITFTTTFAAAQALELEGQAESAERIGSALLYVRRGSDALLKRVERCLSKQDTSINTSA